MVMESYALQYRQFLLVGTERRMKDRTFNNHCSCAAVLDEEESAVWMDTISVVGDGNRRQKILAIHRTSQSQEGSFAEEVHPSVTLTGGQCPRNRAGPELGPRRAHCQRRAVC